MTGTVELPLWLFALIVCFAAVTFASHFLFPSVRWFLRRRLERAVARLNTRLRRPIEPFKLARRHDMIQRLIYDPHVTEAIVAEAKAQGIREDVAFERARRYAREIVPGFSAFTYFSFGIRAARWLATTLYDVRQGAGNAAALNAVPRDAAVVFVMNHRSNMDYVLVTYLAANASALSYAVGEWARVWPLSRLIKMMGAYFIRRRSRGELYRKVLSRYVQMATEGGVTQAVFPEGGLSLDGKLMPPKLGILTYIASARSRPVAFVPVAISYDRVLEDRVLIAAHARGDRRFGARISVIFKFIVQKIWLRLRGRFRRFGRAGVVFGTPVMLNDYPRGLKPEALAADLMDRIAAQMPALPVPVVAHLLLKAAAPLSTQALIDGYEQFTQTREGAEAVPIALELLKQRNLITGQEPAWQLNEAERPLLVYYANSLSQNAALARL